MDHGSKEEYSAFEGPNTPYCEPVYVDAEVQTDLTASNLEVMADCKEKLENKTQLEMDLFVEDVCKNDHSQVLLWHSITGFLIYGVQRFTTNC